MIDKAPLLSPERMHQAATRLQQEFQGTFGIETIERLLTDSAEKLAHSAKALTFVPLLAERFARERLHATARTERPAMNDKPTVLFLCVHNAGRSQMAAGWLEHLAGKHVNVLSGGSTPASQINPGAVAAMREVGINIADAYPKPWTDETLTAADVVITMGCGDACPLLPGKRYLDWQLDDPAGKPAEAIRPIRDQIEANVRALIGELGLPTT